jgi:hypothetical protein
LLKGVFEGLVEGGAGEEDCPWGSPQRRSVVAIMRRQARRSQQGDELPVRPEGGLKYSLTGIAELDSAIPVTG